MEEKTCYKCNNTYPATPEYFYRDKSRGDGFTPLCKACKNAKQKKYREANPEKEHARQKKWREENPEKEKERGRRCRKNNPEAARERTRRYKERHPERVKKKDKRYGKDHKEELTIRSRLRARKNRKYNEEHYLEYRQENDIIDKLCKACSKIKLLDEFFVDYTNRDGLYPTCKDCINKRIRDRRDDKVRGKDAKRRKKWLRNTPQARIANNHRKRINKFVKTGKPESAEEILGCTYEEFMIYLQSKFTSEMTLNNYGFYWDLDHIIACSWWNLKNPKQQRMCFNYRNYQPLIKEDNGSKGAKIIWSKENLKLFFTLHRVT